MHTPHVTHTMVSRPHVTRRSSGTENNNTHSQKLYQHPLQILNATHYGNRTIKVTKLGRFASGRCR